MDLEVVTIGTELLLGFTLDTNAQRIGQTLAGLGIRVVRRTTVGDDPGSIRDAVAVALDRTGVVLTTGGLGPTRDDLTKRVIADLYGVPLEFHDDLWQRLVARFTALGRLIPETNRCQAEVPAGATVLPNPRGTAPGIWLDGPRGLTVMLPGVPREMAGLLRDEVAPRLAAGGDPAASGVIRSVTVRVTGISESHLAERLAGLEEQIAPLTLAYLPGVHGVDLRLTAWNLPADQADHLLQAGAARVEALVAEQVYGRDDEDLAGHVLDRFRAAGATIALAESCTGGLVAKRLTDVPGSSAVVAGGVVAYDNRIKTSLLDVPETMLDTAGAVSGEVAAAMAQGARRVMGTDVGVGVTGVAGPEGGSVEKPVGLVWFGFATATECVTMSAVFAGNRDEIRQRAAQYALFRLLRLPLLS